MKTFKLRATIITEASYPNYFRINLEVNANNDEEAYKRFDEVIEKSFKHISSVNMYDETEKDAE